MRVLELSEGAVRPDGFPRSGARRPSAADRRTAERAERHLGRPSRFIRPEYKEDRREDSRPYAHAIGRADSGAESERAAEGDGMSERTLGTPQPASLPSTRRPINLQAQTVGALAFSRACSRILSAHVSRIRCANPRPSPQSWSASSPRRRGARRLEHSRTMYGPASICCSAARTACWVDRPSRAATNGGPRSTSTTPWRVLGHGPKPSTCSAIAVSCGPTTVWRCTRLVRPKAPSMR